MSTRRKTRSLGIITLVAAAAVGLLLWGRFESPHGAPAAAINSETLPGIVLSEAPWQPETAHLRARLDAVGLPALPREGTVLHIHEHSDIFVNGRAVPVPGGVGTNEAAGFISPVHTHDTTGVVHVESPTVQTYTLGQFFDIWGVRLIPQCVGGYCARDGKTLKVFVNGSPYTGNPRHLELEEHKEIVVSYGTDRELPVPLPSSYAFLPDY